MPVSGIDTNKLRQILTTPGASAPDLQNTRAKSSTADALDLASPLQALGNKGGGGSTTAPRSAGALSKLPGLVGKAAGMGGLGAVAAAGAGAVSMLAPAGSGVQGVAQALNPLANNPLAKAAGNLIGTALPSVSGGLQRLDSKAQTNQMAGIGTDIPDKTKIASGDLTHGANADAIDQTKMAADNTLFGIAQNNTINAINSAKQNAGLVAATVKGNAEVAKNGAQTLGG